MVNPLRLRIRSSAVFAALLLTIVSGRGIARQNPATRKATPKAAMPFDHPNPRRQTRGMVLDLEDAIMRAELIVAVRLVDISEAKIVHGGKSEVITQQFKFEPVRTIKGIFARDALLLTG